MKIYLTILSCCMALQAHAKVLTKQDVVDLVSKNYIEILIQQEKIIQAKQKVISSRGVFDSSINGEFETTPAAGYEHTYYKNTLNMPIENTGNSIIGGYRLGRGDWPVYYQNYLTNSYGDTFLGINIPLLKDRMIDKSRQKIWNNELLTKAERLSLILKRNEFIAKAINIYYKWLGAASRVKIARRLLLIAQKRQRAIDKQAKLGDVGKIDQVENMRLVMQRKSVLIAEKQNYLNTMNELRFYINDPNQQKALFKWQAAGLDENITKNKKHQVSFHLLSKMQPYILFLDNKIEQYRLAILQAKNEMMPSADMQVYVNKQHGSGNSKLGEGSINLALKYKLPLGLRKARGMYAQSKSLIKQNNLKKSLFLQELNLTYQNITNDLNSLSGIYALRKQEVKYAQVLEVAERRKFSAGDSSLFLVNQREQTVASSQFVLIDVVVKYKQRLNMLSALCFYQKKCF